MWSDAGRLKLREFVIDLQWGCFVSGSIPVTHRLSARSRHVNELL